MFVNASDAIRCDSRVSGNAKHGALDSLLSLKRRRTDQPATRLDAELWRPRNSYKATSCFAESRHATNDDRGVNLKMQLSPAGRRLSGSWPVCAATGRSTAYVQAVDCAAWSLSVVNSAVSSTLVRVSGPLTSETAQSSTLTIRLWHWTGFYCSGRRRIKAVDLAAV